MTRVCTEFAGDAAYLTGDEIRQLQDRLRAVAEEAYDLLLEVWRCGDAEGRLGDLWNLAGRMDALLSPGGPAPEMPPSLVAEARLGSALDYMATVGGVRGIDRFVRPGKRTVLGADLVVCDPCDAGNCWCCLKAWRGTPCDCPYCRVFPVHAWTVRGPDLDSGQWGVECTCGYTGTFDDLSDVADGWHDGPCTAKPAYQP